MQRKTLTRKRFARQVTVRLDETLYKKLEQRAERLAHQNPGMQVTVSDVIRSILIQQADRQAEIDHLQDKATAMRKATIEARPVRSTVSDT